MRSGPQKGTRVLAAEEDLGRALVKSLFLLNSAERPIVSDTAPGDIISTNARKVGILEEKGIAYGQLSKKQQGLLISCWRSTPMCRSEIAKQRLDAIRKAGLEGVKFAWMGGLERRQPHYYRVQGATFLVEYDNTQNNANHIHTVWRDFKGDLGYRPACSALPHRRPRSRS